MLLQMEHAGSPFQHLKEHRLIEEEELKSPIEGSSNFLKMLKL